TRTSWVHMRESHHSTPRAPRSPKRERSACTTSSGTAAGSRSNEHQKVVWYVRRIPSVPSLATARRNRLKSADGSAWSTTSTIRDGGGAERDLTGGGAARSPPRRRCRALPAGGCVQRPGPAGAHGGHGTSARAARADSRRRPLRRA